jgi:hypothetical protein
MLVSSVINIYALRSEIPDCTRSMNDTLVLTLNSKHKYNHQNMGYHDQIVFQYVPKIQIAKDFRNCVPWMDYYYEWVFDQSYFGNLLALLYHSIFYH